MNKKFFVTGAILGLIGIILGAFATHGLKPLLSADSMASFETGARYQMYTAFFLFLLGLFPISRKKKNVCFYLALIGVLLFSGSIYFLATNTLTSFDFTTIALVTPIGGTLMILAWIVLLVGFLRSGKE